MSSVLCDWCGAPAAKNNDLCEKCLEAKTHVESRELAALNPVEPAKKKFELVPALRTAVILTAKWTAVVAISIAMVVLGLMGTCMALAAIFTPSAALGLLASAILAFGAAVLLYKLIGRMNSTPLKRVELDKYKQIVAQRHLEAQELENHSLWAQIEEKKPEAEENSESENVHDGDSHPPQTDETA